MNNIYNAVFSILKTALFNVPSQCPIFLPTDTAAEVDWNSFYRELSAQTVKFLPADIIGASDFQGFFSEPLQNKTWKFVNFDKTEHNLYLQMVFRNIGFWYKIMQEQQDLYELFRQNDIPMVILKGAATSIYYPRPEYRSMGDIDFIVRPDDFEKAARLMWNNGFTLSHEFERRHISFKKNGIIYELHQYFSVLNDEESARYLDCSLYTGIENARIAQIENFSFPVLQKLENGLVILEHISQHLESGLGLRHIIDWMMFVDKELDDHFWEAEFAEASARIGLKKLALTATRMCQIYLGLSEEITWCASADEELCHDLMDFVMTHGNFGRKDIRSSKTVAILFSVTHPIHFFKELQRTGCVTWKALKKHPHLKPFAWFYQICRFIDHGLRHPDPIKGFIKDLGKVKEQDAFLDRLGVTRRKHEINEMVKM